MYMMDGGEGYKTGKGKGDEVGVKGVEEKRVEVKVRQRAEYFK